jgi:hypothetical protein
VRQTNSDKIVSAEVGNDREYILGRHLPEGVRFNHQAGIFRSKRIIGTLHRVWVDRKHRSQMLQVQDMLVQQ